MKRSRFAEEQIIGILKQRQAGFGAKDPQYLLACRRHLVSAAFIVSHWRITSERRP